MSARNIKPRYREYEDVPRKRAAMSSQRGRSATQTAARRSANPSTVPRAEQGYYRDTGFYNRFVPANMGGLGEKKYFDTASGPTATVAYPAATITSLNLVPQNTNPNGRIGRSIKINKLNFRAIFSVGGTTVASDILRCILFIDTQANGALPIVTDLLDQTAAHLTNFNLLANNRRFIVLKDWIFTMNKTVELTTGSNSTTLKFIKLNKKLDLNVEFSSTTGAITEIRSNNLVLLISGGSVASTFETTARIRYTDG